MSLTQGSWVRGRTGMRDVMVHQDVAGFMVMATELQTMQVDWMQEKRKRRHDGFWWEVIFGEPY